MVISKRKQKKDSRCVMCEVGYAIEGFLKDLERGLTTQVKSCRRFSGGVFFEGTVSQI
jgi:hypothetical protein